MTATVEKPKRRGPISADHKQKLRQAQLRRWSSPRATTTLPAVRLRHELVLARRAGCHFADAWPLAVDAAVKDEPWQSREEWQYALTATRGSWEAAYRPEAAGAFFSVLSVAMIDCEPY